jgi:hypothetical protein
MRMPPPPEPNMLPGAKVKIIASRSTSSPRSPLPMLRLDGVAVIRVETEAAYAS